MTHYTTRTSGSNAKWSMAQSGTEKEIEKMYLRHGGSCSACVRPDSHCLTPVSNAHEFSSLYCMSVKLPWYASWTFVTCHQTGTFRSYAKTCCKCSSLHTDKHCEISLFVLHGFRQATCTPLLSNSAIMESHAMMRLAFYCWNGSARFPHSNLSWKQIMYVWAPWYWRQICSLVPMTRCIEEQARKSICLAMSFEFTSSGCTTHLRFQNTRQQQVAAWLDIGSQTRLQVQQGPSQYVCYTDVKLHGLLTGCYASHRVSPLYPQYQFLITQNCHFCHRNMPFTAWMWTTPLSWI